MKAIINDNNSKLRRSDVITLIIVIAVVVLLSARLIALYGQESADTVAVIFEDGSGIIFFENGTELHTGQGLNPTGSVPLHPQNTYFYPNGTTSADNITMLWHQCFEDNSCQTKWSNNQTDITRNSSEGPLLEPPPPLQQSLIGTQGA